MLLVFCVVHSNPLNSVLHTLSSVAYSGFTCLHILTSNCFWELTSPDPSRRELPPSQPIWMLSGISVMMDLCPALFMWLRLPLTFPTHSCGITESQNILSWNWPIRFIESNSQLHAGSTKYLTVKRFSVLLQPPSFLLLSLIFVTWIPKTSATCAAPYCSHFLLTAFYYLSSESAESNSVL